MMQWWYEVVEDDGKVIFGGFHQELVHFLMKLGFAPQKSYVRYIDTGIKLQSKYTLRRYKKENPRPNLNFAKEQKFTKKSKPKKRKLNEGCMMTFEEVYQSVRKNLDMYDNVAVTHYVDEVLKQLEADGIKVDVRKVQPPSYDTSEYELSEFYILEISNEK